MEPSCSLATTVLVVDDEFLLRATIADVLWDLGYQVVEADTADTAISIFETGCAIDAVITDLHLPGATSGHDWLQWLARWRPDTPVVLISGSDLAHAEVRDLPSVRRMISKPFDFRAIEQVLMEVLQRPYVEPA
ncbi:MAG: response regulator [Proteobacteria bacterium]|nr:response regulator [Pseudomonadota bacterium]